MNKYELETLKDSNSLSAVHKPDTLTTELWWYTSKLIDTNEQSNKTFKSPSCDEVS